MVELVPLSSEETAPQVATAPTLIPLSVEPYKTFEGGDIPEITEQTEIPFYERFGTDFKLMTTNNPWEKARIIKSALPDRTEIMVGENSQPIITIDGNPYWINKEGFSMQDINDFMAETGSFLAAALVTGGTSILVRLGLGFLTYGATEAARQGGTYLSGGKEPGGSMINMEDVGTVAAIGGVAEAVLPPVLKQATRLGRRLLGRTAPATPTAATDALVASASAGDEAAMQAAMRQAKGTTSGGIPLTAGQASGNRALLETESMMRESTGAYGTAAHDIMRARDASQLDIIVKQAEAVQGKVGAGSGFAPDTPSTIGSRIQTDTIIAEGVQKTAASKAQKLAKEALRTDPAYLPSHVITDGAMDILKIPKDMGIGAMELSGMKLVADVFRRVRTFKKAFERGSITKANYAMLHDFRRSVGRKIGEAERGKTEYALLTRIKASVDNMIDDAMTKGLIEGDPATIDLVKSANKMWAEYKGKFFQGMKDKFGNVDMAGKRMQEILGGETPERVINLLANISKAAPKKETAQLFNRIKSIFGENSEQIKLIKDAVIYRLFTNATRKGKSDITRNDIVKNYTDFFNKSKSLADAMFSESEKDAIRKFVGNVARTMPAEMILNPSGSGRFMARLFADMGQGGFVARIMSMAKGIGKLGDVGGAGYARALAYGDRIKSAPWGAISTAAANVGDVELPRAVVRSAGNALYSTFENKDQH